MRSITTCNILHVTTHSCVSSNLGNVNTIFGGYFCLKHPIFWGPKFFVSHSIADILKNVVGHLKPASW